MINLAFINVTVLGILTLIYLLFYRRNGFFKGNRNLLLVFAIFACIIPFLEFDVFPYIQEESVSNTQQRSTAIVNHDTKPEINIPLVIYILGCIIYFIFFLFNIYKFYLLKSKYVFEREDKFLIAKNYHQEAFSFFNYIFVENDDKVKLTHEKMHVVLRHSYDRIFLSIINIFLWFNPFIYLIRKYLIEVHEYQADNATIDHLNLTKYEYGSFLLNAVTQKNSHVITNSFSSQLKNRIIMLQNNFQTSKAAYYLSIPILFILFSAFTFKKYPIANPVSSPSKLELIDTIPKKKVKIAKQNKAVSNKTTKRYTGKYISLSDTISMYDAENGVLEISVTNYDIPEDLDKARGSMSWEKYMELIKRYQKNVKTEKIK